MTILKKGGLVLKVTGDSGTVTRDYLRVYLAHQKLTEKQLDVTVALTARYSKYVADGVKEPYASTILFSTSVRKEIVSELNISIPHLNNTFNALTKKGIIARSEDKYIFNPNIVPSEELTFKFKVNGK